MADDFPEEIRNCLYDRVLSEKVSQQIEIQKSITFLRDKLANNLSLAEFTELWASTTIDFKENADECMFERAAVIANILHPKYRGRNLPSEYQGSINLFLITVLQSTEYSFFLKYKLEEKPFDSVALGKLSPEDFWKSFLYCAPNLCNIGLLYTSLPATAYVKSNSIQSYKLDSQQQEKILCIRNLLK